MKAKTAIIIDCICLQHNVNLILSMRAQYLAAFAQYDWNEWQKPLKISSAHFVTQLRLPLFEMTVH